MHSFGDLCQEVVVQGQLLDGQGAVGEGWRVHGVEFVVLQRQGVEDVKAGEGLVSQDLQVVVAQVQKVEILLSHKGSPGGVDGVDLVVGQVQDLQGK